MTAAADADQCRFPARVTLENLTEVRRRCEAQIGERAHVTVSLALLTESNSVAVALMIALFRYAHRYGKSIVFVDIPGELRNILEVADLVEVLPVE